VFIWEKPSEFIVRICGENNIYPNRAGDVLYAELIDVDTLTAESWNEIILSSPVTIPDTMVWVGFYISTHELDDAVIGVDTGPAVSGGNYYFMSNVWAENGTRNYNIRTVVLTD
jgi:hypothetical protein